MKKLIGAGLGLALAAAGLGLACSNSGNAGNGAAVTASGACADVFSAYCNKINQCSPSTVTQEFGDVATCINRSSQGCSRLQLPGSSWTSDKLEACSVAVSLSSCDGLSLAIEGDACKTAPGMLANGSPCADSSQCSGGSCDTSTQITDAGFSSTSSVCGKCSTRPPSTCGDAGACTSPQRCQYDSASGTSSCVTPAPEGAACGTMVPCVSTTTCKNSICVKRAGSGAPCASSSDCDSSMGLTCIAMTCQIPSLVGPGQTCNYPSPRCTPGSDCISTFADGGTTSVCVAKAPDNGACDDIKGPRCTSPARCLSGVCTVPDYSQCK